MSAEPLAVAIVGCGIIGLNHARAILRHPDLVVVAVVDTDPLAAKTLANHLAAAGARRPSECDSLAAALSSAAIHIVVICTPSGLHVRSAREALEVGTHVFIEKPVDVSLPRAREIVELSQHAESEGLVVSVVSQHRFDPASRVVAHAVRSGSFGRITSAVASVAWWRGQDYYDSGQWRGTWALDGGGALMNQGIHTLDLLLWFLGNPIEVDARTALLAHERIQVEDVVVATLSFESGALAVLHTTTAAFPGGSARVQVHGDRGSAIIDDDRLEFFAIADEPDKQAAHLLSPNELSSGDRDPDAFINGHLRQYDDLVGAIRERRQPGVTVADAFASLAVVHALYLSATLGRPVRLDEVLDGSLDEIVLTTGGL